MSDAGVRVREEVRKSSICKEECDPCSQRISNLVWETKYQIPMRLQQPGAMCEVRGMLGLGRQMANSYIILHSLERKGSLPSSPGLRTSVLNFISL